MPGTTGGITAAWCVTCGSPLRGLWKSTQRIRTEIKADSAVVQDQLFLASSFKYDKKVSVHLTAYDPDNRVAATQTRSFTVAPADTQIDLSLQLTRTETLGH